MCSVVLILFLKMMIFFISQKKALKKFKSEAEKKNILYIEGSADVDEENSAEIEEKLRRIFKQYCRSYRIKSRNFTTNGIDYAIEATIKKPKELAHRLNNAKRVEKFSIIQYDADDLV